MISIADFFEASHTSESMFSAKQLDSIRNSLQDIEPSQVLALAYFLIDLFATQDKSRVLRRHSNALLQDLAEQGIAAYQCDLGEHYLHRRVAPPKGLDAVDEGLRLLTCAYRQGYGRAAFAMSNFYATGPGGTSQDTEKAELYLRESQRLGYAQV